MRITEPLPNCFSICANAAASALLFQSCSQLFVVHKSLSAKCREEGSGESCGLADGAAGGRDDDRPDRAILYKNSVSKAFSRAGHKHR
jgi:hypothetical protein